MKSSVTMTVLRSPFPGPENAVSHTVAARTPETRARIRRWSRVESVGIVVTLLGIVLLFLAPFASVAVVIWSSITDVDRTFLHWWIWGVATAVAVPGAALWVIASDRREAARFADGQVSVGTVERAMMHPGTGDDMTWYDLRISAVLRDGTTLRRRLHLGGESLDRRVGGPVRFRHNTLDPDALDDVHLVDWNDKKRRRSRRDERMHLPALDRTPRLAVVTANEESDAMTGWPGLYVTYTGTDGRRHEVHLADHVDDTWLDRFPIGSTWQVYSFRDPALANTVVFLTEAHDDVWRAGIYLWLGVRGEVRTGQFKKPRPGSPFFGDDSTWTFGP